MRLNVFTRVFGLLTNPFSPPPAEEKPVHREVATVVMGPNMRRALVLKGIRERGDEDHPGVAIAEARAQNLRNKAAQ